MELAPRIGAAYVLTANQKHVVRASWGRVTDIPNAGYFDYCGQHGGAYRDEFDINRDGVFETVQTTPASTRCRRPGRDPRKHQGYVQEWIVGYRTQLPGGVAFDASYVDRAYKDRPASVELNQVYEFDPAVGHVVWRGLIDPTQNSIQLSTNNTWNWLVYHGLEFTVTKQAKSLNLISTYTRVWDYIDGTWQPNDPAAIIQPDAFPNDGGIGTVRGGGTSSYVPHRAIRAIGRGRSISSASAELAWAVGPAPFDSADAAVRHPDRTDRDLDCRGRPAVWAGVALINGRTVANPLSTTTRFAYATRADGQLWTPWLKTWNARVGRSFKTGTGTSAEVDLDVLNIANAGAGQQFLGGNNITSVNFGQIQNIQTPRAAQFSVRFQF